MTVCTLSLCRVNLRLVLACTRVLLQMYSDVQVLPHHTVQVFWPIVFGQNLLHVDGHAHVTCGGQLRDTDSRSDCGVRRARVQSPWPYSLSGDRAGDENRSSLPAHVAVAQVHLAVGHRSAVKIPEKIHSWRTVDSTRVYGLSAVPASHSPGRHPEVELAELSIADVVEFWIHQDGETG